MESDKPIVVMKPGNAGGAKGLTGEPWDRDTFSGHRTGPRKSTKLHPVTYSTEGEKVHLKSRMWEICKSGSVRGLVADSARGWPRGLLDRFGPSLSLRPTESEQTCLSYPATLASISSMLLTQNRR